MIDRKTEYSRLLHLAAEEEASAAAAEARHDDPLLIEAHRARATYFRDAAGRFAFKRRGNSPKIESDA
ncbi:hypothetical protein [Sphingobium sp. WCS2017Hpa-17]|uniref:hypothetical protein n=1 Tax=Sphingobium sp. WCS2017Hpa-17 TaxID=3073638 RepID=UPI00288B838F|nr:hypothetical protein [Sphingobium sp. WCS2017Hpa-17]